MKKKILFTSLLAVILIMALMSAAFAVENLAVSYRYAVKFVCGNPTPVYIVGSTLFFPVIPGDYATAINVHNPSLVTSASGTVKFGKKVVVTQYYTPVPDPVQVEYEVPGPVTPFYSAHLGGNQAFEIDCNEINYLIAKTVAVDPKTPPTITFSKGFVVIMSPVELDVTAVYTQGVPGPAPAGLTTATPNSGTPSSMDVENIQGKSQKATITLVPLVIDGTLP
jgi:hypothetical protein